MAGADGIGVVKQPAELDPLVTADTRVRSTAGGIVGGKAVDDLLEVIGKVERIERNAQPVGHPAGIDGITDATAALMTRPGCSGFNDGQLLPSPGRQGRLTMPHEHADAVMPRLDQQRGGDAGIDASRHGDDDAGHGAGGAGTVVTETEVRRCQ